MHQTSRDTTNKGDADERTVIFTERDDMGAVVSLIVADR